jgi:hypothetical protein
MTIVSDLISSNLVSQTAVAANKNATAYVEWALKQDERDLEAHPEKFTPYAFLAKG